MLLPIDVKEISVVRIDHLIKSYKQCGGKIEFCLGDVEPKDSAGINERFVTIKTSMALLKSMKGKESFAVCVYSSTPDWCPLNNFRGWINDNVDCTHFDPTAIVKKGF